MSSHAHARASRSDCRWPAPRAGTDRRTGGSLSISASSAGSASMMTSSAPRVQLFEQHQRLRLAQLDPQVRIAALQHRQDFRQHIGRDRRNDAELQPPGQQPAAMEREIGEIAGRGQHALGALRHLGADVGQGHFAGPPLDQRHAELRLQLLDLHGQRRLRHRAGLGGLAEMPVVRQRRQITQLFQRDHADKIFLSKRAGNRIGLMWARGF